MLTFRTISLMLAFVLSTCSCTGGPASPGQPCDEDPVKPKLVFYQPAEYPNEALEQGIEESVLIKVLVAEDGRVSEAEVISGQYVLLNEAALAAAMQCVFEPGRMDCEAVPSWMAVVYRFELEDAS